MCDMTDREKLIQIMENAGSLRQYPGSMARILIENGVTFATDIIVGSKWIPVTERLPEIVSECKKYRHAVRKSARVLCTCVQKDGKKMVKEGYCEFWDDYPEPGWRIPGTIDSVTHWMPLPEPPKGE